MMENNRNYFVAIALSVLILIAWQFLYINPKMETERVAAEKAELAKPQATTPAAGQGAASTALPGSNNAVVPGTGEDRDQSLAKSARVTIDTPALSGSINLTGARFD